MHTLILFALFLILLFALVHTSSRENRADVRDLNRRMDEHDLDLMSTQGILESVIGRIEELERRKPPYKPEPLVDGLVSVRSPNIVADSPLGDGENSCGGAK